MISAATKAKVINCCGQLGLKYHIAVKKISVTAVPRSMKLPAASTRLQIVDWPNLLDGSNVVDSGCGCTVGDIDGIYQAGQRPSRMQIKAAASSACSFLAGRI